MLGINNIVSDNLKSNLPLSGRGKVRKPQKYYNKENKYYYPSGISDSQSFETIKSSFRSVSLTSPTSYSISSTAISQPISSSSQLNTDTEFGRFAVRYRNLSDKDRTVLCETQIGDLVVKSLMASSASISAIHPKVLYLLCNATSERLSYVKRVSSIPPFPVKLAFGNQRVMVDTACELIIRVDKSERILWYFYVVPKLNNAMILGNEFIKAHRLNTDYDTNKLNFGVKLKPNNDEPHAPPSLSGQKVYLENPEGFSHLHKYPLDEDSNSSGRVSNLKSDTKVFTSKPLPLRLEKLIESNFSDDDSNVQNDTSNADTPQNDANVDSSDDDTDFYDGFSESDNNQGNPLVNDSLPVNPPMPASNKWNKVRVSRLVELQPRSCSLIHLRTDEKCTMDALIYPNKDRMNRKHISLGNSVVTMKEGRGHTYILNASNRSVRLNNNTTLGFCKFFQMNQLSWIWAK